MTDDQKKILRLELFALLHDLGKLSDKFIEYRKTWRGLDIVNYRSDPHEHWLGHSDRNDNAANKFKNEMLDMQDPLFENARYRDELLPLFTGIYDELSLRDVIVKHTLGGNRLMNCIRWADAVEAADDRNNPLFCHEQSNEETIYSSTVYGYEQPLGVQEAARKVLYDTLLNDNLLEKYLAEPESDKRVELFAAVKEAFRQGLSDTTLPANDTTLWDHCYAVASVAKALAYSSENIDRFDKAVFRILGIGWNGTAFLAGSHRIADVVGREATLNEFKQLLKTEIEFERFLGNCVYEDLDGIYFLVPQCFDLPALKERIYSLACAEPLYGDIWPNIEILPTATNKLSDIIKVIRLLRDKRDIPVSGDIRQLVKKIKSAENDPHLICPLCRRRKELSKEKRICDKCLDRRRNNAEKAMIADKQTAYFDEIARGNDGDFKRLALMIVNFDLDPWLDGQMISTMFVSDPRGMTKEIEQLVANEPFRELENERRRNISADRIKYDLIIEDLRKLLEKDGKHPRSILYGRHVRFDAKLDPYLPDDREASWSGSPETVAWQVCTKTPTPSTLLDAWRTVESYIEEVTANNTLKEKVVKPGRRYWFAIEAKEKLNKGQVYEAEVVGKGQNTEVGDRFRFVFFEPKAYVLDDIDPVGAEIVYYEEGTEKRDDSPMFLIETTFPPDEYWPIRRITTTPNLGYMILPASKVPAYVDLLSEKYNKYFRKVVGRLQMFVGAIFFDGNLPMSVIFDAAARMLRWPRKSWQGEICKAGDQYTLEFRDFLTAKNIQVQISTELDNKDEDIFHPYLVLSSDDKGLDTYFKTRGENENNEPETHICAVKEADTKKLPVLFRPNLFDYEYLDGSLRRFDIHYENDFRPVAPLKVFQRPYPLEIMTEKLKSIWGKLGESETSQIYNLETLLHSRIQDWKDDPEFENQIDQFKTTSAERFCHDVKDQRTDHLLDAMDLHLHIVKSEKTEVNND